MQVLALTARRASVDASTLAYDVSTLAYDESTLAYDWLHMFVR